MSGLEAEMGLLLTGISTLLSSLQVGLDLSFVNYVFLMEPLANKATEQQVRSSHLKLCASFACLAQIEDGEPQCSLKPVKTC